MVFTSVLEDALKAAGADLDLLPDNQLKYLAGIKRNLDTMGLTMRAGM